MASEITVNPYLRQQFVDDDSQIVLVAPKPGFGLQSLTISRDIQSDLFEVISDLAPEQLQYLDPELDLNEDQRLLLLDYGVLVKAEVKPDQPLFSCNIEDINEFEGAVDVQSLIVDPSFRFEPFDLSKFAILAQERHQSPYRATAWIKAPVTEIERGYWLSTGDAEVISKLMPGFPLPDGLDENLVRKLIAAGIAATPQSIADARIHWRKTVVAARTKFAADMYAVIPNLLPPEQMRAIRDYYRQYINHGFMPFGDAQVADRFRQHNEPFASFLQSEFRQMMSIVVGEEVKLSYVYAASYKEGAILDPHTDREQCEYSISFQVDYQPEQENHVSLWPIFVEPLIKYRDPMPSSAVAIEWEELGNADTEDRPAPVILASGDGLIYKGRELVHYRYALPEGHRSTSLFFHYVAADFAGDLT